MFSRHFILDEQSMSIIEQLGEHMPGGFLIYKADESEEILYANKAVLEIFGCETLEEFREHTGYSFRGMVHPLDYEEISAAILSQSRESESDLDHVEYRIIRKDGTIRWVDDYGHYVESDVYHGLYYVFLSDITDRHEQDESARALHSAVIAALARVYDSVWIINDLNTQEFELFRVAVGTVHLLPEIEAKEIRKFSDAFRFYSTMIAEEDRERFLEAVKPENIDRNTQNKQLYSILFRRIFNDAVRYYRVEFVDLDLRENERKIVVGFKNVDDEVRGEQRIRHTLDLRSAVIEALTQVYDSVWLISDIRTQAFELFRIDETLAHLLPASEAVKITRFYDALTFYSKLVLEEDRKKFLAAVTPESILKNTEDRRIYSVPFRRVFHDDIRYYRLEFAKLILESGETNIVAGFKDVDEEVRKDQQIQHSLSLRSAVIEALTQVYDSVWLINDVEKEKFELFRIDETLAHLLPASEAVKITKFSDAFAFYSGLVLEEDRQKFLSAVTKESIVRNTEDRKIYSVPFRRVFSSGIRYYRLEFAKLDLENGERGIVAGFKDVDDEVRKEQQIQHSLSLRSAVIEALTQVYDSVWLINDLENQRFELFRIDETLSHLLPASEAVKITRFSDAFAYYSNLVLKEDQEKFLEAVTKENIVKNTEDRRIYSVPFRRVFKDGVRYYRLEFAKLILDSGETNIVAGFKDVDDEVRKEQTIQSSLNLRAAVIEALTKVYDSVWLINDVENQRFELYRIDETLSHLLPASEAVKITRYSDAFAFYSKLVLEEDRPAFLAAVTPENILKNVEGRLIYSVPFRRVFKDGVRYYRLEFAKLDLGNGERGIVAGFKDVDEEVRKEQQIQQALREAIDTANASSKAKSDFLSSMSHDIRTPMNGIIGMTSIAAKNLDDRERVADCLRKIQESSGHLLSLINEVLDMNKIESGKVELVEEEFNLAELIDAMLAMTRPQMQAHGHSFRVNTLNVEHEQLIGDSRRIQQIFVNIMSNAIKYTPDGGKISLSVRENPTRTQDFGHFEFIFEDNGYGMTQEFLNHLFEPFARANDKQTAGIQGTGLGMAITRNLVRMMGGDITVKSVYGQGSKFTVSLYLKLQNRQPINYDNFINLRILVADDDPVCCESTCEMLNDMGMTSEWVLSGHAAVDRVRTRIEQGRGFFAVFVDWKLPDLGGVETVRQIRTLVGEEVPIIIFSAYDWTEIEQEARDAGATSFVSKPLFRTKLASLFDALVNHRTEEEDLEAPLRDLEAMHLDGRRILLAEDQEMNAEIAMDFMEMAGLEVDWAKDGEQAVELLKNSPDGYYAMFFTDIQMPVMNGYEAAQVIRAMDRPYARNIPIVAMTANAFNDDIIRAKQAGMNEHIAKPIDVEALARVLSLYIK